MLWAFGMVTKISLCIIILISNFIPLLTLAQIVTNEKYVIKKYQKGFALDVRRGSVEPKAQVWTFDLNQTGAQYFRFIPVDPIFGERIYQIQNVQSNLFVTAKFIIATLHPDVESQNVGSSYSITQENEIPGSNKPEISMFQIGKKNQYWQLMPVPGIENVFVIKNVRFGKVLIPNISESKSYLKLATYTPGLSKQRWHIMNMPKIPEVLSVDDFIWRNATGRISGNIKWKDNSDNEEEFEIWASHNTEVNGITTTSSWVVGTAPANTTSYNFTFPPSTSGLSLYCFRIKAVNSFSSLFSDNYCKVNNSETPPPPPPVGTAGFTISDRHSCYSDHFSCGDFTIRMRLNPVQLNNVNVGRTSALEFSLAAGLASQIVNPEIECCVFRYSNLLQQGEQLRPGTWDLQVFNLNNWYTYSRINFTSGANDIKICSISSDGEFTKNQPFFPCY